MASGWVRCPNGALRWIAAPYEVFVDRDPVLGKRWRWRVFLAGPAGPSVQVAHGGTVTQEAAKELALSRIEAIRRTQFAENSPTCTDEDPELGRAFISWALAYCHQQIGTEALRAMETSVRRLLHYDEQVELEARVREAYSGGRRRP